MKDATSTSILPNLNGQIALLEDPQALAVKYQTAVPFPYLSIDNLFPEELLHGLLSEMPAFGSDTWIHHKNPRIDKYGSKSVVELGKCGRDLVSLLHSAGFLYLLSEISGIWNLLPDPYMHGAGFSLLRSGGKLDVHADRNADPTTGLTRRMALIIYLNENWKHEYGGQLELWDAAASQCQVAVEPIFNRTILMEIGDLNFHGVLPVAPDSGQFRKSFMVYYNTVGEKAGKDSGVHSSVYAPVCYQRESLMHRVIKNVSPPILLQAFRKLSH